MTGGELPDFPVDEATLGAVEHTLDYYLTYEGENGEELTEPRGAGADMSLSQLLDFLSGTMNDPFGVVELVSGDPEKAKLNEILGITGVTPDTPVYSDPRPTYSERDVIRALINEIRRLRAGKGEKHA